MMALGLWAYHWTNIRGLCTPYPVMDTLKCIYIGQTTQTLKHGLVEHQWAVENGDVAASALAEHTLDTGHPLDLTKAEAINHHPHTTT